MSGFDIQLEIGYVVVTGYVTIEFIGNSLGTEYANYRRHLIDKFPDGHIVRYFPINLDGVCTNMSLWMH